MLALSLMVSHCLSILLKTISGYEHHGAEGGTATNSLVDALDDFLLSLSLTDGRKKTDQRFVASS